MRSRFIAATVAAGLLSGCQSLLGFEPFHGKTTDAGSDAPSDAPPMDARPGAGGAAGTAGDSHPGAAGERDDSGAGGGASLPGISPISTGGTGSACNGSTSCTPGCVGAETGPIAKSARGTQDCSAGAEKQQCNPAVGECIRLDIDATEVTMESYLAWLRDGPAPGEQPTGCDWNDDLHPDVSCLGQSRNLLGCEYPGLSCDGDRDGGLPPCMTTTLPACAGSKVPVVCVDWCDARAYCASHGRRLCGRLKGGMNLLDDANDAGQSQWMNACSAGGQFTYAWGNAESDVDGNCRWHAPDADATDSGRVCASASPGYRLVRDLSGNVAEWEDSCTADATLPGSDANDDCLTRGGSFNSTLRTELKCDASLRRHRSAFDVDIGFRCCGE